MTSPESGFEKQRQWAREDLKFLFENLQGIDQPLLEESERQIYLQTFPSVCLEIAKMDQNPDYIPSNLKVNHLRDNLSKLKDSIYRKRT